MKFPKEVVEYYDKRIRDDLAERMGGYDQQWAVNKALIANTEGGYRDGNLASDFVTMLHQRLLNDEPGIRVEADDPNMVTFAENAEIVALSVTRIAGLLAQAKDVIANAAWASFGVFEVGHPLDPHSQDPMRAIRSPNVAIPDATIVDEWEEADPSELGMFGLAPKEGPVVAEEVPQPVFAPQFGYPWITSIDPRLIVIPCNVDSPERLTYICRLRFLTIQELRVVQGVKVGKEFVNASRYADLFRAVDSDGDIKNFPDMLLVAEVYIIRDRNNPRFNNHRFSYVLGHPESIYSQGPNHMGGMHPFGFLKLNPLRPMYSVTLAEELLPYADMYNAGVRAIKSEMERMLNRPLAIGAGAGLTDKSKTQLQNKDFKGLLECQDPDQIKRLFEEAKFDIDLLRAMQFVKSLAQARSRQSDLDQGVAIKDITARQVQAILDSTGINVQGMAKSVAAMLRVAIIKMMHLAGLWSMSTRDRRFNYGPRFAAMERGTHDFTTSLVYDVAVTDSTEQVTSEERVVWIQFLKLVSSFPQLFQHYDMAYLARATLKKFGESPRALLQVKPGEQLNLQEGVESAIGGPLRDQLEGQHPERDIGSRGFDAGNMVRGQMNVGMGTGE